MSGFVSFCIYWKLVALLSILRAACRDFGRSVELRNEKRHAVEPAQSGVNEKTDKFTKNKIMERSSSVGESFVENLRKRLAEGVTTEQWTG